MPYSQSLQDTIQQNKDSERAMIQAMEHRLERYQDQQDAEYATLERGPQEAPDDLTILYEERRHLTYEIRAIEGIIETDDKYSLVTPEHWNARLAECNARLAMIDGQLKREQLHEESRTIHKTIMLHFDGIDALNKRQGEVDAQIAAIDEQMEVR
jgi:hypothetical protein